MQTGTFLLFILIFRTLSRVFWDYGFLLVRKSQVFLILSASLKNLRSQILITINYTVTELIPFTKKMYTFNEPKLAKWQQFTIGKYHIHTMEIIKLFPTNVLMLVKNFALLTILLFCNLFAGYSTKLTTKIGDFAMRKKHEWLRQ